jgi:hypothetical protein
VAVDHAAEHHVLGKLERLGLDHHHALLGARDDQIELRGLLELGQGRVEHVLAVDVADTAGADRPVERNARKRDRRRYRQHCRDVGVDLRVERQYRRDDLHFVIEAVGNSGRIGRSMSREVSVSFSEGRPSRLKKPPGILPAA